MKHHSGYFLADSLLALFIFLLGAAAIHRLAQATHQAQRHHQWRLRAHSLLQDAPHWQPHSASSNWERSFDVMGEPTQDQGFFLLKAREESSSRLRSISYEVLYRDSEAQPLRLWRHFKYWRHHHAGI